MKILCLFQIKLFLCHIDYLQKIYLFTDDYGKRTKEWCYCYRRNLGINTNMALESMHRNIKVNYFQGKKVKRLDHALNHIITFLDDKCHDHLIKSIKGKITRKRTTIARNHTKALRLQNKFQVEINNGICILSNDDEVYTVTFSDDKCSKDSCGLVYKDCQNVCLDVISCTCFQNSIHFEMCIHCHIATLFRLCNSSHEPDSLPSSQPSNHGLSDTAAIPSDQSPIQDKSTPTAIPSDQLPIQDKSNPSAIQHTTSDIDYLNDLEDNCPDLFDEQNFPFGNTPAITHSQTETDFELNMNELKKQFSELKMDSDKLTNALAKQFSEAQVDNENPHSLLVKQLSATSSCLNALKAVRKCRYELKHCLKDCPTIFLNSQPSQGLRKRKLSHQIRTKFVSVRKKPKLVRNIFKKLSHEERKDILSCYQHESAEKNEEIVEQGEEDEKKV